MDLEVEFSKDSKADILNMIKAFLNLKRERWIMKRTSKSFRAGKHKNGNNHFNKYSQQ